MGVAARPSNESLIRGGSFMAIPKLALPHNLPANLRTMMMPVQTLSFKPDTPLRLLDKQSHAGFYSSGWGLIPFSFSQNALEEIEVQQVSFMVERLPWAEVQTDSAISPWPGYLDLMGEAPLAVLAKPGSRIAYSQGFQQPMQLEMLCGVSPDTYSDGSGDSFSFIIRQRDEDDAVLAELTKTLQPGINEEHRAWQKVEMALYPSPECTLEFGYFGGDNKVDGTGAFAQLILRPVN
jgi:hypothetical protein